MSKVVYPFVRSAYNYDTMAASDESALSGFEPTLTQQSGAEDCDINVIMERFARTGELPIDQSRTPRFGDFTGINDYHTAQTALIKARDAFMSLPAKLRSRFNNDPAEFVDFCTDPANSEELIKLGLATPLSSVNADSSVDESSAQERGGASSGRPSTTTGTKPSKKPVSEASEGDSSGGD